MWTHRQCLDSILLVQALHQMQQQLLGCQMQWLQQLIRVQGSRWPCLARLLWLHQQIRARVKHPRGIWMLCAVCCSASHLLVRMMQRHSCPRRCWHSEARALQAAGQAVPLG